FLGGLDPQAQIEHAYASLTDGVLAGKPLAEWLDKGELLEFCRRYNVGWIVCRSASSAAQLRKWPAAEEQLALGGGQGFLFAVKRPLSFTLKGQARWLSADAERIVLADVVPENGEVVLSLHFQEGLRASPGRVQVEPDRLYVGDNIAFVRLSLTAP